MLRPGIEGVQGQWSEDDNRHVHEYPPASLTHISCFRNRAIVQEQQKWALVDATNVVSETGGLDEGGDGVGGTVGDSRGGYRRIAHLKGHSSRILHLDWTTDGRCLQTCGQDYHLLFWEILPPPLPTNVSSPSLSMRTATATSTPALRRQQQRQQQRLGSEPGEGSTSSARNNAATSNYEQQEKSDGCFSPRLFNRGYLLRDAEWATWSSTVGWPVQVTK